MNAERPRFKLLPVVFCSFNEAACYERGKRQQFDSQHVLVHSNEGRVVMNAESQERIENQGIRSRASMRPRCYERGKLEQRPPENPAVGLQ